MLFQIACFSPYHPLLHPPVLNVCVVMTPVDRLPHVDFIFHVCVPASLKSYAQETMLVTQNRPASLCILFYRHTDLVETRKTLGLSKLKDETTHPNEEKALQEVLAFTSDGSTCRGSTLLAALGDNASLMRCGGKGCCDNCRFRLGLDSSPLALKHDSKSVSMGSGAQDTQNVENCYLDITRYVLEALREAKASTSRNGTTRKASLTRTFANVWDNNDCPTSSTSLSTSEWDRISPIRGICLTSFLRRHLLHLLLEQGVIHAPTAQRKTLFSIDEDRFARFKGGVEKGRTKVIIHNVRLFQSYLDATVTSIAGENIVPHTGLTSTTGPGQGRGTDFLDTATAAVMSPKDGDDDAIMNDAAEISHSVTTTAPKAPSAAVEADELVQELLEFDKLISQYEQQDESELPVTKKDLEAIDKGATFFPRLIIPLGCLSWIASLPYLVQYEIWRLWNSTPRKLKMEQLVGPIRKHLDQTSAISPRQACIYIHAVANDNSVQEYANVLKSLEAKGLESAAPLIFSAKLQSSGDRLSLQPPSEAQDCRVYRKFGSSRFLRILLPNDFLGSGSQLFHTSPHGFDESGAMLTTPLYVAGRYFRYLCSDFASTEKALIFFAECGAGISKEEEMTANHVREWCLPAKLNDHLTLADEQVAMNVCFAPSRRCCSLPRGSMSLEKGPSHDANGFKFNGGCGRISRAALDLVWSSHAASDKNTDPLAESSCSQSHFEGAIGGMRGVWVLDETLGDGVKIVCRPSQQIFNLPMECLTSPQLSSRPDRAYDTVEVYSWDRYMEARVNCRFIQAIEYRGVPTETLRSCVEMACTGETVASFESMRAKAEYNLEKCKTMRLIPDHTGLLKPGEAFLPTGDFPSAKKARQVIVSPANPVHGDDIVKLNLVSQEVLRQRDLAASSAFSKFFDGVQSGIVIGKGMRDPSERAGGEWSGRIQVCWLEQIVSKIDEASSAKDGRARQSPRPQVDDLCLTHLRKKSDANEIDNTTPGQYLFRKLKQDWFVAQMHDLLTILNDLKGPNSVETMRIAAIVDELVSFEAAECRPQFNHQGSN